MKKILKICIILSFTFLLTGCVDCLKYNMSISQIEKQLLDHDFFKDWTIKKQTDSSLSIE